MGFFGLQMEEFGPQTVLFRVVFWGSLVGTEEAGGRRKFGPLGGRRGVRMEA